MQFRIMKKELAELLKKIEPAVSKTNIMRGCVGIDISQEKLRVYSFDNVKKGKMTYVGIMKQLDSSDIDSYGCVEVDYNSLKRVVDNADDGMLELYVIGEMHKLSLKYGGITKILELDNTRSLLCELSYMQLTEENYKFSVPAEVMFEALSKLASFVDYDQDRTYINGMLIKVTGSEYQFVATNGKIMGEVNRHCARFGIQEDKTMSLTLPYMSFKYVMEYTKRYRYSSVNIYEEEYHVGIKIDDIEVIAKKERGVYPDTEIVWKERDSTNRHGFQFRRDEMIKALKALTLKSDTIKNSVKPVIMEMIKASSAVKLYACDYHSSYPESFQIIINPLCFNFDKDCAVKFNPEYMLRILNALRDTNENPYIIINDPEVEFASMILPDLSDRYLIMPFRKA